MVDVIDNLKQRARRLHRHAQAGDPSALARLRGLAEFSGRPDSVIRAAAQRRHALSALSAAIGFSGWPHAKAVLQGDPVTDRGTLMFRASGGAFWNIWSADYAEARDIREEDGGYLLPYRRHFQIVDRHYVAWLGLDPEDEDWARIERDWVRPTDRGAWARLTARAIEARLAS